MASTHVSFNCGCGFSTSSLEEAIKHSDAFHHTLAAFGEIRAEKELQSPEAEAKVFTRSKVSARASFDKLRANLER